ncbi:hypothetical protein BJ508DRAFT_335131 [Ascobolus immersus RN42]|uniref:Endonuclease/exonuclease/phosphatase domain-containing protein n=1 Tax=Ascobolus immersus RN42 TaxID=1160509 RepID=A0A3N4HJK1_ASCIM|nr:hypothetical protein BJ508DRAFT_335131 [Ascobolus immersus RN42]
MTRVYITQAFQVAANPIAQSHYRLLRNTTAWSLVTTQRTSPSRPIPPGIDVVSWCVGHTLPSPFERTYAILDNIQSCNRTPGIIFLQDVHYQGLDAILTHPWVMDCYHPTDVDGSNWIGDRSFGTVALVRRDLDLANVFRVPLMAEQGRVRDALVLDFVDRQAQIVRFMSTNLGTTSRGDLLAGLAEYSPARGSDSAKFVLVGETGADAEPPVDARLKDVYLDMGRNGDDPNGWSWGMNCYPRMGMGERRQKAFVSEGVVVHDFGRIGAGPNAPLLAEAGGYVYASENSGVMLILANLS